MLFGAKRRDAGILRRGRLACRGASIKEQKDLKRETLSGGLERSDKYEEPRARPRGERLASGAEGSKRKTALAGGLERSDKNNRPTWPCDRAVLNPS